VQFLQIDTSSYSKRCNIIIIVLTNNLQRSLEKQILMEHLCLPLSETYLNEIALLDLKWPGVMQLLLLSCLNSFDKGVKPQ